MERTLEDPKAWGPLQGGGAAPAPRRGTSRGTPPPGRTPGGQSRGAPIRPHPPRGAHHFVGEGTSLRASTQPNTPKRAPPAREASLPCDPGRRRVRLEASQHPEEGSWTLRCSSKRAWPDGLAKASQVRRPWAHNRAFLGRWVVAPCASQVRAPRGPPSFVPGPSRWRSRPLFPPPRLPPRGTRSCLPWGGEEQGARYSRAPDPPRGTPRTQSNRGDHSEDSGLGCRRADWAAGPGRPAGMGVARSGR